MALINKGVSLVLPSLQPETANDLDWVFPDIESGLEAALAKGANTFWLNTILYSGHPIESTFKKPYYFIGQLPGAVDAFDDKIVTNRLLSNHGLPIPESILFSAYESGDMAFPFVIKPVRGRGSQGVRVIYTETELNHYLIAEGTQANPSKELYLETFLPGREVTLTVMPPGSYEIHGELMKFENYWCLPPVLRYNHTEGIAPYNGVVAVVENSRVFNDDEVSSESILTLSEQCSLAAKLVDARAPIRIDCREGADGKFYLFDLNMKPNMTGPSRSHRSSQISLTGIAAERIGWSYPDLLMSILRQAWTE